MSEDGQRDLVSRVDMHPAARTLFGWTTRANIKSRVFLVLSVVSALLLIADMLIDRHPHNDAEALAGFYGIFGFASFAFVVLMGWPLGRLLRRSENYYDDLDEDELSSSSTDDEEG